MMADRIVALDIGPRRQPWPGVHGRHRAPARPPRHEPRRRASSNCARDITRHLLELAQRRDAGQGAEVIPLPALTPRDLSRPPRPSLASLMRLRHAAQLQALEDEAGDAGCAARLPEQPGRGIGPPAARRGDDRFVEFSQVVKAYPGAGRARTRLSTASTSGSRAASSSR